MRTPAATEYNAAPFGFMPDGSPWPAVYKVAHRNAATGAAVYEPMGWKETAKGKERRIAALLTESGYNVVLRREERTGDYEKNPDAYLSDSGAWAVWEFKSVGDEYTTLRRSVQRKVHDARTQAKNAVIYLPERAFREPDYLDAVNVGIRLAFSHLAEADYLDEMILLLDDGRSQRLTREEFFDERGFSGL